MGAGRDLDNLIAGRVMGWKPRKTLKTPPGFVELVADVYTWWTPDGSMQTDWDYEWSNDIHCAWLVVERMHTEHKDCLALSYAIHDCSATMKWQAVFRHSNVFAIADTAPLAICRAALKARWHER